MRKSIRIKKDLHSLIDKIDNNELLEMVYYILESKNKNAKGELIKTLTEEQKEELYDAYEESKVKSKLIDLEQFKARHSKWLEK